MSALFPITSNWSWASFFLYVGLSYLVVFLCIQGAKANSLKTIATDYANKKFNRYYVMAVIVLTLLATVRSWKVGTDTITYIEEFRNFSEISFNWERLFTFRQAEPGYQLVLKAVKLFSNNYHLLFFVVYAPLSFAYIKFISYFYKKEDSFLFLPLFIFYFFSNMSGMRAALATIFLLLSFIEIDQKKYGKAMLLTLVACTFHYTMLYNFYIIFITWLFSNQKIRKKKWLWFVAIVVSIVVTSLGLKAVFELLAETKYSYYSEGGGNDSFLGSLVFVILGIVALANYKRIISVDQRFSQILIITLGFLVAYPMIYITGAYRIPNYYIMPRLVIWDYSAKHLYNKVSPDSRQIVRIGIMILVFVYLLFRFTRGSVDGGFIYQI